MSLKQKIFRYLRELLKDAGIGFAFLGTGTLVFQDLGDVNVLVFSILFIVLGVVLELVALCMLFVEHFWFDE